MQLPSPRQRTFFEQAALSYHDQLGSDTTAQAYLTGRALGPEAASTFRLGVVRKPLVGHEQYQGRLAIPYITPAGINDFVFRCLVAGCEQCKLSPADGGHPKYLATSGHRSLYNVLDLGTSSQTIHICEGELDALTLSVAGFPAVGVGGVDGWKPWYTICFADFAEVFVWGDGDKAGRKFASFIEKELRARRVAVPPGEDVNSVYVKHGAGGLRGLVAAV